MYVTVQLGATRASTMRVHKYLLGFVASTAAVVALFALAIGLNCYCSKELHLD